MAVVESPESAIANSERFKLWLRESTVPYVGSLIFTVMLAYYLNYLSGLAGMPSLIFKAQSPGIYVPFVGFPISLVLWFICKAKPTSSVAARIFLIGLAAAWIVHLALIRLHGDMSINSIWLYLPVLAMLYFKTPTQRDGWAALVFMAWVAAVLLVLTRVLEILDAIPMFNIPDKPATEWEKQHYWLPLSGHLGIDGRWPGPFGFNAKTGFFSVFIVIVGVANWRRNSWLLVAIGGLGIVLTGGRGPYVALLAGILVLILLGQRFGIQRIPMAVRLSLVVLGVAALAAKFAFFTSAGVTGREEFWSAFLELWRTSIWTGVGQEGIWNASGTVHAVMDAHSIYIQELTKYGLLGFIMLYGLLAFGLIISLISAARGWAAPLAIIVVYLVSGFTDLLHDGWQAQSTYSLMIIVAVLAAAAWRPKDETTNASTDLEQGSDGLALKS